MIGGEAIGLPWSNGYEWRGMSTHPGCRMRLVSSNRRRRVASGVALLVTGGILAACSSGPSEPSTSLSSRFTGLFSGSGSATSQMAAAPGAPAFDDENCPGVEIRTGASTLMKAAPVPNPTSADLRYQLSFTNLARQCFAQAGTLTMKVGVEGRIIVGPAGAPPQVEIPLRYAVVQEGVSPKTITTKFKRITASVPPGGANGTFSDVESGLSFPMPPPADLEAYVVYVGFDELGDRNERRPAARAKKPPARH